MRPMPTALKGIYTSIEPLYEIASGPVFQIAKE
jgi:hypothetical protein